ncbi:hypothetical protein HK098_005727 [Nowakowskiella sp. JEL0407]|nr:hypothetical protein HK098_005727 [Nowakowskiella sp. JEL0407]
MSTKVKQSKSNSASTVLQSFERGSFVIWKSLNKIVSNDVFVGFIYAIYIFIIVAFLGGMLILLHHFVPDQFPYKTTSGMIAYYLHVVPGILYFLISILQFSPFLRQKYIGFHRYMGRVYLILQLFAVVGIVALWFGAKLEGGIGMYISIPFVAIYWLATGYGAYRSAVVKDIPQHQIWIIRNTAFAYGIIWSRPAFLIFMATFGFKNPDGSPMYTLSEMLSIAILVCFWICVLFAEWFIYARFKKGIFSRFGQDLPQKILLEGPPVTLPVNTSSPSASLTRSTIPSSEFTSMKLIAKHEYTSSHTTLFRFQLLSNSPSDVIPILNIPPTHHLTLRSTVNNSEILRTYTPISSQFDHMNGYVDFLISKANGSPLPSFSHHIASLKVGSEIDLLPKPYGNFHGTKQPEILLIAIGSGITPLYSLMQHLIMDSSSNVKIKLVYYAKAASEVTVGVDGVSLMNTTVEDSDSTNNEIPLAKEILQYQKFSSESPRGAHLVTVDIRAPKLESLTQYANQASTNVIFSNDRVTVESMKSHLPNLDTAKKVAAGAKESWDGEIGTFASVFVCGPMNVERELRKGLARIGYGKSLVWTFGLNGR